MSDDLLKAFEAEAAQPIHSDGVDEESIVAGHTVETYYRRCEGIASGGPDHQQYLRVIIDDGAVNIETRILYATLINAGWTPPHGKPGRPDQEGR